MYHYTLRFIFFNIYAARPLGVSRPLGVYLIIMSYDTGIFFGYAAAALIITTVRERHRDSDPGHTTRAPTACKRILW